MRKIAVTSFFLLILPVLLFSQVLTPVKWSFSSKSLGNHEFELVFTARIDNGWHLYSQFIKEGGPIPTSFNFEDSPHYQKIGKTSEPSPIKYYDNMFKMDLMYFGGVIDFRQKIRSNSAKPFTVKGFVEFMACDDEKCTPPTEADFEFNLKLEVSQQTTTQTSDKEVIVKNTPSDSSGKSPVSQADSVVKPTEMPPQPGNGLGTTEAQKDSSLWWFFFVSFLGGLAAIFTPCVFPMIPMTVTFFMHDKEHKRKGRIQALVYGFSIIFIYTVVGTLVAITLGANFANWLSTHWIPNVFFFLIFTVFAASFLGMFDITLPSWLINKSDQKADQGGISGAFFMAFTLVLVSFSCTGPIVGAILVESARGELLMPIIGMFGFALAFAVPFTLFAFFPTWLAGLPKSGGWLNAVKVILGFVELALGLKFLSVADQTYHWGILDREVYIAFWIVIFTLMGFYLLGKLKFAHDSDLPYISVPRTILAIITFTFVVYMIPGIFGAPLKALSGYLPPQHSHDFDLNRIVRENSSGSIRTTENITTVCDKPKHSEFLHLPHGLEGYFDYEQGLACAKQLNKPVFIDFTGHGCVNCREMEANVWADPRVLKMLREDYLVIALYVDDKTQLPESEWITSQYDGKVKKTVGKKYADYQISRFNVNAQPYYVLLDTQGELLTQPRAYNLDIDAFVDFLKKGIEEFKKRSVQEPGLSN